MNTPMKNIRAMEAMIKAVLTFLLIANPIAPALLILHLTTGGVSNE